VPVIVSTGSSRGVAAVIALITACAGCGSDARAFREPITLRVGAAKPSTTMTYLRTSMTRDYLVSSGGNGRPIPRILESWSASDDGLTWHLRLRPGVQFHDGSLLTAQDIAPRIESLRDSIFAVSRVLSARPVDDLSLEVHLADRSSFFVEDLAAVYAEKAAGTERIGTGPFVTESQTDTQLSFRSFPHYYRGRPEIDRVEIETYPDLRNAWTALMRNQIDLLYELNREARQFVEAESSVQVSTLLRPYVIVLGFNPSRPQLKSARIRQALGMAIDRERLVAEGLQGQGQAASSFVWPKNWAFDPSVAPVKFAPARALELLDESGLTTVRNGNGMPSRLTFKVMVYAPLARMALALQRQLARLDIDMQIETPNSEDLVRRMATGEFDAFLFEMSGGPSLKWAYLFWHSKGPLRRSFGITYGAADASLDKLKLAKDDAAVRAAVAEFQLALANDPPAAFLAWGEIARASTRRFEIPTDGETDVFHSIWRWQPASGGAN